MCLCVFVVYVCFLCACVLVCVCVRMCGAYRCVFVYFHPCLARQNGVCLGMRQADKAVLMPGRDCCWQGSCCLARVICVCVCVCVCVWDGFGVCVEIGGHQSERNCSLLLATAS